MKEARKGMITMAVLLYVKFPKTEKLSPTIVCVPYQILGVLDFDLTSKRKSQSIHTQREILIQAFEHVCKHICMLIH